jgi:hypothetical protein
MDVELALCLGSSFAQIADIAYFRFLLSFLLHLLSLLLVMFLSPTPPFAQPDLPIRGVTPM